MKEFDSKLLFQCDVGSDDNINMLFTDLKNWDGFDGFAHAIGLFSREAMDAEFLDGFCRESLRITHDISVYRFPAMAKAALPMRAGRKASLLTLSYLGAVRTMPHYNVMGLAKAIGGQRALPGHAAEPPGNTRERDLRGLDQDLGRIGYR